MMTTKVILVLSVLIPLFNQIFCIWPPPYKINLSHSEDFVIFETFGSEDGDDIYDDEDEMIKKVDIRSFNIEKDQGKYFRLHKAAMKHRNPITKDLKKPRYVKWKEHNYDREEHIPWIAGVFNGNGSNAIRENSNVFYLNEMAKSVAEQKVNQKREEEFFTSIRKRRKHAEKELEYNYDALHAEYMADMKGAKSSNETLDFVDVKEEESIKEALQNIANIKSSPRNCTKEEMKGIGLAAVECYWIDLKKNKNEKHKMKLGKGILKILLIWFSLYIIIAVPCWCQKGWCCCCFRCRFCMPQKRIDEVKKYLADNPAGTYRENGKVITYKPSHYEKYAQKRLEQALMKL